MLYRNGRRDRDSVVLIIIREPMTRIDRCPFGDRQEDGHACQVDDANPHHGAAPKHSPAVLGTAPWEHGSRKMFGNTSSQLRSNVRTLSKIER